MFNSVVHLKPSRLNLRKLNNIKMRKKIIANFPCSAVILMRRNHQRYEPSCSPILPFNQELSTVKKANHRHVCAVRTASIESESLANFAFSIIFPVMAPCVANFAGSSFDQSFFRRALFCVLNNERAATTATAVRQRAGKLDGYWLCIQQKLALRQAMRIMRCLLNMISFMVERKEKVCVVKCKKSA